MNTIPHFEDLLDDTQSVDNDRQWLDAVAKFNTELFDYGNETFGWCVGHTKKSPKTFHNTLLGLARHNLVYMDCVKTALATGNSERLYGNKSRCNTVNYSI